MKSRVGHSSTGKRLAFEAPEDTNESVSIDIVLDAAEVLESSILTQHYSRVHYKGIAEFFNSFFNDCRSISISVAVASK